MEITKELINKISDLAKLNNSDPIVQGKIKEDLERMFSFFTQMDRIDTQNVEPLVHLIDQSNIWRADTNCENMNIADVLNNAPVKDTDYFKVPKIQEE